MFDKKITSEDYEKIEEIINKILEDEDDYNSIQAIATRKWLNYSLAVIKGRSLPSIYDGLKPGQRRTLFTMKDLAISNVSAPKKSARIVGSCLTENTLVTTDKGLIHIKEIDIGMNVLTRNGFKKVTKLFENPKQEIIELTAGTAYSNESDMNHEYKTINQKFEIIKKKAKDFKIGDYMIMKASFLNNYTNSTELEFLDKGSLSSKNIKFLKDMAVVIFDAYGIISTISKIQDYFILELKKRNLGNKMQYLLDNMHKDDNLSQAVLKNVDELIKQNMLLIPITEISKKENQKTYDFTVEDEHEFFANGVLSSNCIGQWHPHGDTAVYDSLVGLAQPFTKLHPLIEGQGNFGSIDGDNPAAMRYCVTGDTLIQLSNGEKIRIDSLSDKEEDDIDISIVSVNKKVNKASKFFNSGKEDIIEITTKNGFILKGSKNHPILTWSKNHNGFPHITWKTLETITFLDFPIIDKDFLEKTKDLHNDKYPFGTNKPTLNLIQSALKNNYYVDEIKSINQLQDKEYVYSVRVDSDCHSFVANGFINHNTEARFSKEGFMCFQDFDKNVVPTDWNYDNTEKEPLVLPVPFPNLIINGVATGIAVGMATSIPSHNSLEVMDAITYIIKQFKSKKEISLEKMMELIPAPDFPTGGIVYDVKMKEALTAGNTFVKLRAKYIVEKASKSKVAIVITEIPYQKNKSSLVEQIANLVKEKKIDTISDLKDQSNRKGIRIYIELKSNVDPEYTWNFLLKHTDLDCKVFYNMTVIKDEFPKEIGIIEALTSFVSFRQEVLIKKHLHILKITDLRLEILTGLIIALESIDKVIKIIKGSEKEEEAIEKLQKTLSLSERQCKAILEMKIQRLLGLEKLKLEKERDESYKTKEFSESVINDEKVQYDVLLQEAKDTRKAIGKERCTEIGSEIKEITITREDSTPREELVIYISSKGYLRREPLKQRNGLKGISLQDEDFIIKTIETDNHSSLMFITDEGTVFTVKTNDIPDSEKGRYVHNILEMKDSENIVNVISIKEFKEDEYLLIVTENGLIKKSFLSEYTGSTRSTGVIGINLQNDKIIFADKQKTEDSITLLNSTGQVIIFGLDEVPETGRNTKGVIGMKLKTGKIISAFYGNVENFISVSELGIVKWSKMNNFKKQGRAGTGVLFYKTTDKSGNIIFAAPIKDEELLLSTTQTIMSITEFDKGVNGLKIKLEKGDKILTASLKQNFTKKD